MNVDAIDGPGQYSKRPTVETNPGWTRTYFTGGSPKGVLTPTGDLTMRGLNVVLLDLYLESNYFPICKKGHSLYSNSDEAFGGRYYVLQETDESILLEAASSDRLEIHPRSDLGEYIEFTDVGLQEAFRGFVPFPVVWNTVRD